MCLESGEYVVFKEHAKKAELSDARKDLIRSATFACLEVEEVDDQFRPSETFVSPKGSLSSRLLRVL